jgi:glyoxylase-like metal-dependent hydrolase (beta-lactamase superfamily II)
LKGFSAVSAQSAPSEPAPSVTIRRFIPVVHRIQAGDGPMPLVWGRQNCYLLETKNGILIFDGLRTVSEASAVNDMIQNLHKPVLAVFLTHAHPDHYGGIPVILKNNPQAQFITTQPVADALVKNFAARNEILIRQFGTQWAAVRPIPTQVIQSGQTLTFDDVSVTGFNAGPGESDADTYWLASGYFFKTAFTGDLVIHGIPAPGQSGFISEWICSLPRLKQALAGNQTIYPGHGEPGSADIIDWQLGYLRFFWQTVADAMAGGQTIDSAAKEKVREAMLSYMPDDKGNFYILFGIDALVKEIVREGPSLPNCGPERSTAIPTGLLLRH